MFTLNYKLHVTCHDLVFVSHLEKRKRHELFVLQGMEAWNFKTAVACSTW